MHVFLFFFHRYTLLNHHIGHTCNTCIQLYLVLVGHVASGPHLFDHQVPELGLCFQIGLKDLLPAPNTQLQTGDSQEQKRS